MLQAQMMSGRNNSISEPPHLQDDDIESLLDEFDQLEQELLRDVRERRSARAQAVNLNQNLAPVPMARQRSTPFQYASSHVLEALNEEEEYQYQQPTGMKYLSRSASVTGHGHNIPGRHYQQYRNKSFQTTNMYAIDQYYVEQQRLFMRGQQDVSPATSRCTSPSTSHSEQYSISSPSPDLLDPYSDARRWSPPQNMYSQSRPIQKVSSPQLSVITTSSTLLNQSDARPKSPVHYPSLTAPFAVLLTSNQVLHGSLYRTNPTPPGTLPYQLLHPSKKKKVFSLSSLFKKSSKDKLAPAFPGKLNACALAVFGNRVYVYDYVKGSLTGHAGAKRWVRGPMTEDMEVVRDYDARKGSVSSTASSRVAMYPGTLTQERPVVVLEISNACVAEDGIWVLHCSGMDLVRSGECVDLFLQASDCDEMVRWLQVLKRAALTK